MNIISQDTIVRNSGWVGKMKKGQVLRLEAMTNCPDRQPVVDLLRQIIPEYDPLNPPEKQKTASLIVD